MEIVEKVIVGCSQVEVCCAPHRVSVDDDDAVTMQAAFRARSCHWNVAMKKEKKVSPSCL